MSDQEYNAGAHRHWLAGEWLAEGVLDPLREINAQCIDLLCDMARADAAVAAVNRLPVVAEFADLWRSLCPDAKQQLAASPYLLVDAGFSDDSRWFAPMSTGVHDLPRELRSSAFIGVKAEEFVRRVLVYGWHLARSHRQVARVVLGMTPAAARRIAALSLRDLDWICAQQPGWVRPRWDTQPRLWGHLLSAAAELDRPALHQAGLRGIQMMGANAWLGLRTPGRLARPGEGG